MQKIFEFFQHIGKFRVLVQTRDLNDGAVTTPKLADGSVTEDKFSEELKVLLTAGGGGGGTLSDELGDSVLMGITQRRITACLNDKQQQIDSIQEVIHEVPEQIVDMQTQIDNIVSQKADVSLTAVPDLILVGEETDIELEAETDLEARRIELSRDNEVIASDAGMTASLTDTISIEEDGEVEYMATFTIGGVTKRARKRVSAVLPIFYGAGQGIENAVHQASVRKTPAGRYVIPVNAAQSYLLFCVPATMSISQVLMNGFGVRFTNPRVTLLNGRTYKVYQSANTYDVGTLEVEVS